MTGPFRRRRILAAGAAFIAVLCVYAVLLVRMQVTDADAYRAEAEKRVTHTVTLSAPRGNIYDRNGVPLVVNRQSYAIQIDRSVCRDEAFAAAVCQLAAVLEETGDAPADTLPISRAEPFAFTEENCFSPDSETAALKAGLGLDENAAPAAVIDALLGDAPYAVTPTQRRALAGAYYEIEKQDLASIDPYLFARDVSMEAVVRVEEGAAPAGVEAVVESAREYAQPGLASHVLGRVGSISAAAYESLQDQGYSINDSIGVSGVESAFESWLRGQKGERVIRVDVRGNLVDMYDTRRVTPGNDLYLTLDASIQAAAEESLARRIADIAARTSEKGSAGHDASAGAVVAVEVGTGDVLAMASYPGYDLADFDSQYALLAADARLPLLNRAIGGAYEPGSTFKLVTATAATRAGTLDPHARYVCGGRYTWFSSYQPTCYQGRAHGALDLPGAIMQSCNCYFFEAGRLAGAPALAEAARLYGFGEKTGIELPGEVAGRVADPAARLADGGTWTGGDTIQAAIGQSENMMTPLQLAVYASTLAADGVRYAPHIGYRVTDPADGRVLYERETEIAGRVEYAGDAAQQIREGMEAVALSGAGAPYFYNYPVKVACKTGTAEVPGGSANSVMILYAPADDPQIAIAAVIEHGGLGHYSFPIAKDILNAYFGLAPSEDALPANLDLLPD